MRHIIPISGKDSLATAIVQLRRQPDLDYEFMFNPTGEELPAVFGWLKKVEAYLGKPIFHCGDPLRDIIEYEYNWFLPSHKSRYCTRKSKILPMEEWIGKTTATVYYGIRADENRIGYIKTSNTDITPVYPLKEEGIDLDGVYRIITEVGLKPPTFFWESVYDAVCKIVGEGLIKSLFTQWEIDVLFSWRTRMNCAMCFNQRRYEWVGLLEHHPELFWEYESWEHKESEHFFIDEGYPLALLAKRADKLKAKRINEIVKFIRKVQEAPERAKQMNIFSASVFKEDKGYADILEVVSCGLLCGK